MPLLVFVVAMLFRALVGTALFSRSADPAQLEFPDEQQYWLMARSLAAGEGLQDELGFRATRMPLYPALLSLAAFSAKGIAIAQAAQWLIGALGAVLTAALAGRLFDRRAAWIAGLLTACDPFLVSSSSLLLTETLFTTLLAALWWVLTPAILSLQNLPIKLRGPGANSFLASFWGTGMKVGLLATLCIYTRESAVVLLSMVLITLFIVRGRDRAVVLGSGIAALFSLAALVPWAVRNRVITGQWCFLTYRGGISLYDGVGPRATGASDLGDVKQMPAVLGLSESEWNRYFLRESITAIRADPMRIVRLAGVKLKRTWNPLPNLESYQTAAVRTISAAWTLPSFALALTGTGWLLTASGAEGRRKLLFLLLPALYVSLLHSVFVGSVRYRLVAVPFLHVLAAYALVKIMRKLRRRPCGDGPL